MSERVSSLELDRYLAGEADAETRARIEASPVAMAEVARRREQDAAFLGAWTSPDALAGRARPSDLADARARRSSSARWLAAVAASALVVASVGLGLSRLGEGPEIRAKGGSQVQLWVKRGEEAFAFAGGGLREGDTLLFRYTTAHRYVLVLDFERGAAPRVLVASSGGQSRSVAPGQERLLDVGARLDGSTEPEWIVVVLSDAPLASDVVVARLAPIVGARFSAGPDLRPALAAALEAPDVEVAAWLVEREPPGAGATR